MQKTNSENAMRFNAGKPRWSLVKFEALEPMIRVLMFGAKKYAPNNWKKSFRARHLLDSLNRHIGWLADGFEYDYESGLHHTGHILCNGMFYAYHYLVKEDRKEDLAKLLLEWEFCKDIPAWSLMHYASMEPMLHALEEIATEQLDIYDSQLTGKQLIDHMQHYLGELLDQKTEGKIPHVGYIMAYALVYSWKFHVLTQKTENLLEELAKCKD